MFDFLGEALRKIGNTFNAEFRDFKRALFSYFKSDSNSNKTEQDESSEFTSISEDGVPLPRSEQDKKDLENHISNIKLLDNPTLSNYDRFIITPKLLSIEDLYKIEIKGIESTANPYQRMKYKGKSDQHKFYLDNEGSFQLISDLEKNDALFGALIEGDPTLTKITSQHKIDLDILHQHKKTIRRSSGSIYGLIQDHPDQNAKLLFAIQHNDLELVDIAFKNGASIKVLTENKNIFSSISSNAELIDYFQNKYLFTSVESPNSNLYDLKKGLSDFWKTQDGNGNILFYLECLHGDEDAIEKLLKIDDNKNRKGKDDLKKELSDFWKTQDENGNTLLHLACSQGNEDAIKELLKVDDIDVGITNNNGKIALELIEDKNLKSSICAIVLEKENLNRHILALPKSNATLKSKITEKLLGWQTLRKIQNILEPNERPAITVESLLKSHPDSLIFAIRFRGDFANVIDAFKNGASIQTLTRDKNILSSIASNAELIKFLNTEYISSFSESYFGILKKPDDLKKELSDFWKTQDENGNTLLHLACLGNNRGAIEELLKIADIDVEIKNNNGKIAFELIEDKSLKSSISDISTASKAGSPSKSPLMTGSPYGVPQLCR